MAPLPLLRLPARQCLNPRAIRAPCTLRPLSQTSFARYPRKDSQDKDSINTEATEYSKSGTDDASARQEEASFDPSTTDPQQELDQAGEGNEGNPLDVSPANPQVSKQRGETEGGAQNSGGDGQKSGSSHGSPPKNGSS